MSKALQTASFPDPLTSEVRALREKLQTQYALIELLTGSARRAKSAPPIVDLAAMLPVHPRRQPTSPGRGRAAKARSAEVQSHITDLQIDTPWLPVPKGPAAPLTPNPGWAIYTMKGFLSGAIGFSLCGVGRPYLEKAIDLVAEVQRQKQSFTPVFLTDSSDLEPFRRRGYAVEYMSSEPTYSNMDAWRTYAEKREEFVVRKWNLTRIIYFGAVKLGGLPADTGIEEFATLTDESRRAIVEQNVDRTPASPEV